MFRRITRRNNPVLFWLLLLMHFAPSVFAVELPAPSELEGRYGVQHRTIEVVEPHESTIDKLVFVNYAGFPMNLLLTHWFGDDWKKTGSEIVFLALDGYRSVIPTSRLQTFHAYLAFARSNGADFVVGNREQNQKSIALGPYYLIWDNRDSPEQLSQGAYGWPYQVTRVELQQSSDERNLLPANPNQDDLRGSAETKQYCLTCHHIRGQGGTKFPEDLAKSVRRWTDTDLKSWIDDPGRTRPGTTMPSLNRMLPPDERRQTIERIVHYLRALAAD